MIETNILNTLDYIFFSNSNTICNKVINEINLSYDYTFTLHSYFHHLSGLEIINNKHLFGNVNIKNIINYNKHLNDKYKYIGGRFFGAKPEYFIHLNDTIYNNICDGLKNNFIHQWHDETELNLFFFNNIKKMNYNILDISYHIDEGQKWNLESNQEVSLMYLNKTIHLKHTSFINRDPFLNGIINHVGNGNTNPKELYQDYISLDTKNIELYYINLDRSLDRNNLMLNQFKNSQNMKYTRISAIDGLDFTNDTFKKYSNIEPWRYNNNKCVFSCLLSHLNAIKQAYFNKLKRVIILEDEIDLTIYKKNNTKY